MRPLDASQVFSLYEEVGLQGSASSWILKRSRFDDVADLERRRWRIWQDYQRIGAIRWDLFQQIEGSYAAFYSDGSIIIDDPRPGLYVYMADISSDGSRSFSEGQWARTVSMLPWREEVSEEKQPELAYELCRLYWRLARRGSWLGVAGEALDRAITRALPDQPTRDHRDACVEINGRVYWYAWRGSFWEKFRWPEQEMVRMSFGAGDGDVG
jgi:hypothetical protein